MASDPYRYFRVEARELLEGITQGALDLEKGAGDPGVVAGLLRLAHTLKGASRVVKQGEVAEMAHAIEGLLSPYREQGTIVPRQSAAELLRMADRIAGRIAVLDSPSERASPVSDRPAVTQVFESVRVDMDEIEHLRGALAEVSVQLNSLHLAPEIVRRALRLAAATAHQSQPVEGGTTEAARARANAEELQSLLQTLERSLTPAIGNAGRELAQAHEVAERVRLVPAAVIFAGLATAVRDAASTLGKRVEFVSTGGEIRLESNLLAVLRDALLHIVRNAVAHGIETEELRVKAGKPETGRVSLAVERRGNRVAFLCRDDGAGVDVAAVRSAAAKAGILTGRESESLDKEQVVGLLLKGGLSTTGTVTGVSGRGIGLDVVREAAALLEGTVSIRSTAGEGTTVEVDAPASALSIPALAVSASGWTTMIPLDCICRTLTVAAADVARAGDRDSILWEGQAIPFVRLAGVLHYPDPRQDRNAWPTVVVAGGNRRAAVAVERLGEVTTVLLRPLPPEAAATPAVIGACMDAAGNPRLILDPAGLVTALQRSSAPTEAASPRRRPGVLVVDDSLTTRMLEQSILESAGFAVDLACSGEEGLQKAGSRDYALFLVDIEMPGMDGFEFLSRTRADARLKSTPVILVTSRNSVQDKNRGRELGANDYIVKSEFDQAYLLRVIRELVGEVP